MSPCTTHLLYLCQLLTCRAAPDSSDRENFLESMTAVGICTGHTKELDSVTMACSSVCQQVYSRPSSLVSSSPQRSTSSDADGERQFNLNGNSVPTATQTLMTMYRRRSPEEFNPKLVSASGFRQKTFILKQYCAGWEIRCGFSPCLPAPHRYRRKK